MIKFAKFVLLPAVVAVVAAVAAFFILKPANQKNELVIATNGGSDQVVYSVELAKSVDELKTGLMNRESLDENSGMLFDLRSFDENVSMWMKNTPIALDMMFIDEDGMIYWIYENAEPESTKLIIPPYPAHAVLEVNGGDAAKKNIRIGDVVKHKWFKSAAKNEPVQETTDIAADNSEPAQDTDVENDGTAEEETQSNDVTPAAEEENTEASAEKADSLD